MPKLIVGCGYLGSRVARFWRDEGQEVYALTRRPDRVDELQRNGWRPLVGDVTSLESLADLPAADTVLFAVGFDRTAGHSIDEVYVAGLRNLLDALPGAAGPLVYVSSTGVYAQNDGSWVDEDAPCEPVRDGGRACLAAERALAAHPRGSGATILRLGGIYGPSRVPRVADVRAGRPVESPSEGYLNLIHVEDAVAVVVAAAARRGQLRVYNVTDGQPVWRQDYFAEVARLVGAPAPEFAAPADPSARRARGTTSKRVSNTRMLDELRVTLRFPSYREGLAAALAESAG